MKTKLFLLILGIAAMTVLPASAELTVEDITSREYVMNHGNSSTTADLIELQKASVNGDKADLPIYHKYDNKPLVYRWVNRFFEYLDPAQDKGIFLREDTKFSPSVDDL